MHYLPVSATPQPIARTMKDSEGTLRTGDSDTASYSPAASTPGNGGEHTPGAHRRPQVLCVSLHGGLVITHVVLLVVYVYHFEHAAAFDINPFSTNWLPFIVTFISQATGTVRASRPAVISC